MILVGSQHKTSKSQVDIYFKLSNKSITEPPIDRGSSVMDFSFGRSQFFSIKTFYFSRARLLRGALNAPVPHHLTMVGDQALWILNAEFKLNYHSKSYCCLPSMICNKITIAIPILRSSDFALSEEKSILN